MNRLAVVRPVLACPRTKVRVAAFVAGASATVPLNASCDAANPPQQPQAASGLDLRGYLVRTCGSLTSRLGLTAPEESKEGSSLKSIKSERPGLLRCQGSEVELYADYEMLGFVGRGGFGTVRKARDRTTGLIRAIKAVDCEEGAGEEQWERLFGEVEALMAMSPHPNIVRLHSYYRGKDTLYLIEEFCSGGTLEQRLKQRGGRLQAAEAADVLRHMLRSVLCCHAHGLSHRDLKLDNYVYASSSGTAALKLIDFGLSVSRPLGAEEADIPRAYVQAGGTLEHSAPETLPKRDAEGNMIKEACYAPPADIWSLGAILFHLLSGEPLINLDCERTSSAEFYRMARACAGHERDLLDEAALRVRDPQFISDRLALARRRAPGVACELLEQMLRQDPAMRITATQALEHAFVQLEGPGGTRWGNDVFDTEIIVKMRSFAEAPALRRLVMLIEAHMLGPQDDDGVRTEVLTFRAADQRGCGELSAEDIATALRQQGLEVPADLSQIWRCVDINQNGKVNLIEFVAATMEPRVFCEPKLFKAAFRILDADGDGWITQADIEALLNEGPLRAETARAILRSAEPDERGRVGFAAFCSAMLPADVDPSLAVKVADYVALSFV